MSRSAAAFNCSGEDLFIKGWEPKTAMEKSVREYGTWVETLKPDKDYLKIAQEKMRKSGMVKQVKSDS